MTYTNKLNLSPEIYSAIVERQSKYNPGEVDYSVTEILNPPRIVHLTKRHYGEIEVDVSDLLDAWLGHLMHDALEDEETTDRLVFVSDSGVSLSGAYDYYLDGLLKDYKSISAWTIIHDSMTEKWESQLNIYAWLLRMKGKLVKRMGIEVFIKDWSPFDAMRSPDYPKQKQYFIPIQRWAYEDTADFVDDCLCRLESTKEVNDADLPPCSSKDMWEKPGKWAIMREGQKKAVKLFDTKDELMSVYLDPDWKAKGTLRVEERPGERTRCEKYCACAPFCNQYQDYKSKGREG